jgi:hypothetical protein
VTGAASEPGAVPWRLAAAAVLAVLVLPLFLTEQPPLLDYPNHLARMHILTHATDPAIAKIYSVHWRLVPNLGMDLVVPSLARIMPLDAAGRCFIAAALVLPVAGVIALHRAAFGRRSWWPLGAALIAYNALLLAGFLNFMVSIGFALLGAALWLRQRDRPVLRLLCATAVATAIFFCHLFGCAFFGLLLLGFELAGRGPAAPAAVAQRVALLVPPFLPASALLFLRGGFLDRPDHSASATALFGDFSRNLLAFDLGAKLDGLTAPFGAYSPGFDRLTTIGAVALLVWGLRSGRLGTTRWLLGVAAFLAILYPWMPGVLLGTGWIDVRLVVLAAFALVAAVDPAIAAPRPLAIGGAGIFFAVRMAVIALAWSAHAADLAAVRAMLAPLEPGARVLAVVAEPAEPHAARHDPAHWHFFGDRPSFWHLPAPAIVAKGGFWPFLFAAPSKQPVGVNPPFDASEDYGATGAPAPAALLRTAIETPDAPHQTRALDAWPERYDYVLLLAAGRLDDPSRLDPAHLELVSAADVAALFRIRRSTVSVR